MSGDDALNKRGNHPREFSQGVGGWAEYTVSMTETKDTTRHEVTVPPGKVIPVIFLPGVMGSNLRMSKARQTQLERPDNRAWRPDDMMGVGGKKDVVTGSGLGGWFKNATPGQRQLVFDPAETEVEYYYYSENNDRFDPDGKETKAADARHQNVSDTFTPIPPLMGSNRLSATAQPSRGKPRSYESPAQIARWRGWSEVLFAGAYGDMLRTAELHLNNMLSNGKVHPMWRQTSGLGAMLMQDPSTFGAASGAAITKSDLKKIAACWYPVHAMGYNFLKSNGVSAVVIAKRLRGLLKGYQKRGFQCDEVIIVTHSMGGLLARALIHPDYGNMLNDKEVKILGMYHNVMPTIGAAGAYKRMRFGFQEKTGTTAEYEAEVLGKDGMHATAILANAPAPLEMMPGAAYGQDWIKVVDIMDKTLWSWPRDGATALESIYLQPANAWWRLINPGWVNPGRVIEKKGGGIDAVKKRIVNSCKFLESIEKTFHPNTYASYCASRNFLSYGEVVFKVTEGLGNGTPGTAEKFKPPPVEQWTLLSDDAKGLLSVQAGSRILKIKLMPASAAGDETVPSERSARHITGNLFVHGINDQPGYEHQSSYAAPNVLASMLYSIVQIAKTAKWD
ncbi:MULTISPECIES: triacylglycerol lipase [unclassified Janthinobacterium]|uniref:esterase/lipase family protein n=1 Tax=unclassified Janthinobacterium TaxID=2610881 RepID=UPI00161AC32A|nr:MULTISPECIES: hypothetical protein [unclassified Janthinobacterium]MBB5609897.1 hypothetical protein [Janthinobacterium sp. S3T4]MBB5615163.1 hypothetical protein [Janthinobacterium sp. S3M3]